MINVGDVVMSISGHDRGELYIVVKNDERFAYVSDGRLKPVSKPKKKNIKHINKIGKSDEFIELLNNNILTDVKLKYLLKRWRSRCLNQTL